MEYFEYMALVEAIFAPEGRDKFLGGLNACFQWGRAYLKVEQVLSVALKSSTINHMIFRTYSTDEAIRLSNQIKNSSTF